MLLLHKSLPKNLIEDYGCSGSSLSVDQVFIVELDLMAFHWGCRGHLQVQSLYTIIETSIINLLIWFVTIILTDWFFDWMIPFSWFVHLSWGHCLRRILIFFHFLMSSTSCCITGDENTLPHIKSKTSIQKYIMWINKILSAGVAI